jgi:ribosomal protein S18 acetylase RimI-like enzyme
MGFNIVRVFWRLDRTDLELLAPVLSAHIQLIDASDPQADLQAWLALYNRAFEGEWRHWPEDIERFTATIGAGFGLAMVDQDNQPLGISVGQLEPVGHILVVCSAPEHRDRKIAKALIAESLRRFAGSARTVSIMADVDSLYQSHLIIRTSVLSRLWSGLSGREFLLKVGPGFPPSRTFTAANYLPRKSGHGHREHLRTAFVVFSARPFDLSRRAARCGKLGTPRRERPAGSRAREEAGCDRLLYRARRASLEERAA